MVTRTVNPLRLDPSRTGQIRRAYSTEINARFNALIRDINKLLIEDDAFGVRADRLAGKRVFNASDCGAGSTGDPGFQPGNDCAKGGTIKLPDSPLKSKASSENDLPKQIGDYAISYSPGMGNEARADPDGTIKVGPKFFDMEVAEQNHTLIHEWVHQSGLEEAALNDNEFWDRLKAGDLWGKPEGEYDVVWGPGGNKPNENVVESVIAYINEPEWLRDKYPGAFRYIHDRLFTLPRKSVTGNSDCGAGSPGNPGFSKGNDCAAGDGTSKRELSKRFPRVRSSKQLVDGRRVLKDVPNTSSIASSLTDYEIMPGIREIDAVKEFNFPRKGGSYSVTEQRRTEELAEKIRRSGKISPLIVVIDREGPYILEGGHRFDALNILEAKSFPAMVVIDRSEDTGVVNSSDCGAGKEGSPGFQPGNDCAKGGGRSLVSETDYDHADVLLTQGVRPDFKREMNVDEYAPGKGIDRGGLYVVDEKELKSLALGYGNVRLYLNVDEDNLDVPPEMKQLGYAKGKEVAGEQSLDYVLKSVNGGVTTGELPPSVFSRVEVYTGGSWQSMSPSEYLTSRGIVDTPRLPSMGEYEQTLRDNADKWFLDEDRIQSALTDYNRAKLKDKVSLAEEAGLINNSCGAGSKGDPGFQPGNTCARGGETADEFLRSKTMGEVEVYDRKTGALFQKMLAEDARQALREAQANGESLTDYAIRPVTPNTERERELEQQKFWEERQQAADKTRLIESLKTSHGLKPGHPDYVEPPEQLYHATFYAEEIRTTGFKTSDELGGKQTLGGSTTHTISFTTKENAELYRDGLNVGRRAARGEIDDAEFITLASRYGVSGKRAREILRDRRSITDPYKRSFQLWQDVSFEGKQFPLFIGSDWRGIESTRPAEVVSIPSAGITDILYNPGETEWRVGGVAARGPVVNTRWRFQSSPAQYESFMQWLRNQVAHRVLQGRRREDADTWFRKYIDRTYKKGFERAFDQVRKKDKLITKRMGFYEGTKEEFLRSSFGHPVSLDRVKLLASRTFEEYSGVSEQMSTAIGRELVDGMIRGDGPREVARNIAKQVGMSRKKALMIARTETLRSHNQGALDSMERMGVERVGVAVEWSTSKLGLTKAGNPSPCKLCAPLEGMVLTIDEARWMFPRHANCFADPDTPIRVVDAWKRIADIVVGDLVLTHEGRYRRVKEIFHTESEQRLLLRFGLELAYNRGTVIFDITHNHPIMVLMTMMGGFAPEDRLAFSWVDAERVIPGDQFKVQLDGTYATVKSVVQVDVGPGTLYNFAVEEDESYVAQGVVVHNCMCAVRPANVGESQEDQKRTRKEIVQAINDSLRAEIPKKDKKRTLAEQRKRSWWVGAGKPIKKERPQPIVTPSKSKRRK